MSDAQPPRWVILIHQIPPNPAYLRVKIGRRLARIGAVALKNSVYVLPRSESSLEDFQWVRSEIVESGGEATIVDAQLVDGLSDTEVEASFQRARDADYALVAEEARSLVKQARGKLTIAKRQAIEAEVTRLERRLADILTLDFFGASGRENAAALLQAVRERLFPSEVPPSDRAAAEPERYRGRTWVTRAGIHVDRIASAWLIARFIDPEAQFKFVPAKGYTPEPLELRFDMYDAEFGHEGDLCTFEVLCTRLRLGEPGLRAVAEVVNDIDLKDAKFGRPETEGVAAQIVGLALLHRDDQDRLRHGSQLFDQLLAYYARNESKAGASRNTAKIKKARK
jgi:hypothetical protein